MKVIAWVLVLCLTVTSVFAVQSASIVLSHLATDSNCLTPLVGNATAGTTIYALVNFTNTGTEDLNNARINSKTHYADNLNRDPGDQHVFNMVAGGSGGLCYRIQLYNDLEGGLWTGEIYVRNQNWDTIANATFPFNVTPIVGTWEGIDFVTNMTQEELAPGETRMYEATYTNRNPTTAWNGLLSIFSGTWNATGTSDYGVTIPAGGSITVYFNTSPVVTPQVFETAIRARSSTWRVMRWDRMLTNVTGPIYQYCNHAITYDKLVYQPGEMGSVSAVVENTGNVTWDPACCFSHIWARGSDGGPYVTLNSSWYPLTWTHAPGEVKTYTVTFTNPFATPMTTMTASHIMINSPFFMESGSCSLSSSYSPSSYPDLTPTCTNTTTGTGTGAYITYTCTAPSGISFFQDQPYLLESVTRQSGNLFGWWQGVNNGNSGIFMNANAGAVVDIRYILSSIITLDAFAWSWPLLLLVLAGFVFGLVRLSRH